MEKKSLSDQYIDTLLARAIPTMNESDRLDDNIPVLRGGA